MAADPESPDSSAAPEPAWVRRQRLADVFGDVLPETTSDERDQPDEAARDGGPGDAQDRWLRGQVPPHHG